MAASEKRWWPKGMLFGALCGALWVPVQLSQPPEPDIFGSLLVGLIIGSVAMVFCGRFLPTFIQRKPRARLLLLVALLLVVLYGGLAFVLTNDAALSFRIAAPRGIYALALGLILLRLLDERDLREPR
jgi:hypothetical protein